jgi:ABC-type uncharacterized transport system permease subunit
MDKMLGVILGLVIVGLCIYGWTWLLTLAVNYILASFGIKPVGMLLVFCCPFVLGKLASYFKRTQVKE